MKTYNQTEVDEIIYKVKNIKNAFLEGIDSNLKSIQNIKETFVTGAEKQIEKLQNLQPAEPERKEWRQKPRYGEKFFYIENDRTVKEVLWGDCGLVGDVCMDLFEAGNCFPCELFSEEQVQQIAWQNQLNSLLAQYAIANGVLASKEEIEDDCKDLYWTDNRKSVYGAVYYYPNAPLFNNIEVAQQAIEDVVEPFCEAHPDFVW